jgi:gamma-glutamyl:cysteine ligase YbdK (ATP-grasp superfamily)
LRQREIEENLWQAIRHGWEGTQIDFAAREVIDTRTALERLVEWTAPARDALGIDVELPERNGAQRARDALEDGAPLAEAYRAQVAETAITYPSG